MTSYAIIHVDEDGNVDYRHTPDVVFLFVDDRAPSDRVYCFDNRASEAEIAALVGTDGIGHKIDGSPAAARLDAAVRGES